MLKKLTIWLFTNYNYNSAATQKEEKKQQFIFQDINGERRSKIKDYSLFSMVCLVALIMMIGLSITRTPHLNALGLEHGMVTPVNEPVEKIDDWNNESTSILKKRVEKPLLIQDNDTYGFYYEGDNKKHFIKNMDSIGSVIPDWFQLENDLSITVTPDKKIDNAAKKKGVEIIPSLRPGSEKALHNMLSTSNTRVAFIKKLEMAVKENGYNGININFEGVNRDDQKKLKDFFKELYTLFHTSNLKVTRSVQMDSISSDIESLADYTDRTIVHMTNQHNNTTIRGPLAAQGWFISKLNNLDIPPDKLVISLRNEGYDWNETTGGQGESVTYSKLMEMSNEFHLQIQWDKESYNPYVRYRKNGEDHIMWFLDAATFLNQVKAAKEFGVSGIALQNSGTEDPGVWKILKQPNKLNKVIEQMESIDRGLAGRSEGEGEIVKIKSTEKSGSRNFEINDGIILRERYSDLPSPVVVKRYGKATGKQVVLSFDDGPSAEYTPKVLDILKKYGVKGSFFVVGENAVANPNVLKRIVDEGHEIGNHTYSHARLAKDNMETKLELNSTQRVIQKFTGVSTNLFRPPYTPDIGPSTKPIGHVVKAQEMGYYLVGSLIDPRDWEADSTKEIVDGAMDEINNGNIILLHDSGGDRSHTIEALPIIIEKLREKGYTFVSIGDLINKKREEMMPPVKEKESSLNYVTAVGTFFQVKFSKIMTGLFSLLIGIGIIRLIILFIFSYKQKIKGKTSKLIPDKTDSTVSVVIAAFNEETVIGQTIRSILKSTYKNLEIIVVDDGSKDSTAKVVTTEFGEDKRVRLIQKPNGGKSSAVNRGFKESSGDIVITIDADTILSKNAISQLVRHFENPLVGAVSGNVKVGNVRNLLTLSQHIEYVTGFNLERRAFSKLNCVTVVPGAVGAWRKQAIQEVGFLDDDTLAEDADITIKLLKKGYQVAYEENALAFTEAPEDLRSFMKQRFRWSYGMLQCLWKHKDCLFNKKTKSLGFIGMPNAWFSYILQAASPLMGLSILVGLLQGSSKLFIYFGIFLLIDYIVTFYSFKLEKEKTKPLFLLWLQRTIYLPFMTLIVWKAFFFAAWGVLVGWNKLQRSGNVDERTQGEQKHVRPFAREV
ncbi:glycosyltransferase [Pseudalkalibacillus caeni]|uniref:Glycosyltransferase n=1 Tax=Exobacillus caeni TaxID=2574798 RepID=A0A5R9F2P5_9BACL|nr:glycosyltransferase [Pseudalkalibacillus caeni]TLS35798.1 glycosyltransferase [Pseudalkalibacillus caeni]